MDAEDYIVSTRPYNYVYDIECKLNPSTDGENDTGKADHVVFLVIVATFIVHNSEVVKFYKLKDFFIWALKKERGKSVKNKAVFIPNKIYLSRLFLIRPTVLFEVAYSL